MLVACGPSDDLDDTGEISAKVFGPEDINKLRKHWPLPQVPLDTTNAVADDPYAQHLGQYLFFDSRFSSTGDISCATCHDPTLGWSDGKRLGETLSPVGRHTMSLWNAGYVRWAFWDGRCDTLWCQALEPFESDAEMGGNRMAIVHSVVADETLASAYEDIFGALPDVSDSARFPADARPDLDPEHPLQVAWTAMRPDDRAAVNRVYSDLGKAIAAFERLIVARDAPFDRFAEAVLTDVDSEGLDAISESAARGLKLFLGDAACHFCHEGPNFTNQEFANVGLGARPWMPEYDRGRIEGVVTVRDNLFNGTGLYSDDPETAAIKLDYLNIDYEQEGQFKVPGLRNVTTSAPYFHGGHFDSLEEVVRHYGTPNVEEPEFGHREDLLMEVHLEASEIADLVAFLETLTSDVPLDPSLMEQPVSPFRTD